MSKTTGEDGIFKLLNEEIVGASDPKHIKRVYSIDIALDTRNDPADRRFKMSGNVPPLRQQLEDVVAIARILIARARKEL